ncbi:arylamine N-acetyltransferase [Billgrantia diversa]|uniref:arylamine N-acetyltransferase n=1 Tax=Halomonas sp. MCCC 1A13316 TaxID=2733487 RepID=UPI001E599BB2|nr:arylamine N-acetyltransferase [Halomonas sp. MCCC 1A13316]
MGDADAGSRSGSHRLSRARYAHRADFGEYNYLVSPHPASPCIRRIVAQRNGEEVRLALTDLELKVFRPGSEPELLRIAAGELPGVLQERFGLELTPEKESLLLRRAETLVEASSESEQLET